MCTHREISTQAHAFCVRQSALDDKHPVPKAPSSSSLLLSTKAKQSAFDFLLLNESNTTAWYSIAHLQQIERFFLKNILFTLRGGLSRNFWNGMLIEDKWKKMLKLAPAYLTDYYNHTQIHTDTHWLNNLFNHNSQIIYLVLREFERLDHLSLEWKLTRLSI
jgi:hypothetical protein